MYQLTVTVVNASKYYAYVANEGDRDGSPSGFVLEHPTLVAPGSSLPPHCLGPKTEYVIERQRLDETGPDTEGMTPPRDAADDQAAPPPNACSFTLCSPKTPAPPATRAASPLGSLTLLFAALRVQVTLYWRDFSQWNRDAEGALEAAEAQEGDTTTTAVGPVEAVYEHLDGGFGDVKFACAFAAGTSASKADPDALRVTITMTVENDRVTVPALTNGPAVVSNTAVRPSGSSKVVLPSRCKTWVEAGNNPRRKRLLAFLGNLLPMAYQSYNDKKRCPTRGCKRGPWPKSADVATCPEHNTALNVDNWSNLQVGSTSGWGNAWGDICGMPWGDIADVGWDPAAPIKTTSCVQLNLAAEVFCRLGRPSVSYNPPRTLGGWAFKQWGQDSWVPCGAHPLKKLPSVGDAYIIWSDLERGTPPKPPHTAHVGFFLHVPEGPNDFWVTADAGQSPGGSAAFLSLKRCEWRIPEQAVAARRGPRDAVQKRWEGIVDANPYALPIADTPYLYMLGGMESELKTKTTGEKPTKVDMSGANRVLGWIDIDTVEYPIESLAPSIDQGKGKGCEKRKGLGFHQRIERGEHDLKEPNVTENDYWFLGAWIDHLLASQGQSVPGGQQTDLAAWVEHFTNPNRPVPKPKGDSRPGGT